jgi:Undecaprenyl-phosphate glucose phosphotransferase
MSAFVAPDSSPAVARGPRPPVEQYRPGGWFDRLYSDRRGQISRPKLLASVVALDVATIIGFGLLAQMSGSGAASPGIALTLAGVAAVALVVTLQQMWAYTVRGLGEPMPQVGKVLKAVVSVFGALAALAFLLDVAWIDRRALLAWAILTLAAIMLARVLTAQIVRALGNEGRLVRRTVIVGGGERAEEVIDRLAQRGESSIRVLGVFDDRQDDRSAESVKGFPKIGTFEDLGHFCRDEGIDLLIVTIPLTAEYRLLQVLQKLFELPVDVRLSALSSQVRLDASAYTWIGSVPMFPIFSRPLSDWDRMVKTVFDRVVGAVALVVFAPVMAAVALAVKLDSRGPVFFKQKRYGFNNELIEVWKFRSMYTDMSDADAARLATRDDPRITPVGRIIRKTSLDELPQLVNVVLGTLSLVGPRPHATQAKAESELYEHAVHHYFARHNVKPGITGWAQINGWRGETDTRDKLERRIEHDMHYIENWSLLLDVYILAVTPFALLNTRNAY